ncbi:unnamed protein product [Rotaria sp. Silwood1]|nr:unnamed protein product [Rotaria sp. Silwood1]CAF3339440.1 unnamed protein product [Rotaria sp. Silwood1]CAF3358927.1 unnamed protein product [Rotaria sp. Silwood1]CAF4537207.1 unnamed protein product [Rotaria sp. Silwood1]CAF4547795.1 unnamed protein product [Rotaria sp. Silwood1]
MPATGIGHHINPLNNPFPNRSNQSTHQTGSTPHYGGGVEKCARCSKTVYLAEKKVGAGRAFHSSCFSCGTCKRKLDATTLSEHKGEIYCKSCYKKQFGPHGLISGVAMSTEKSTTHDYHSIRRSSYGNDLDPTNVSFQQARQRANSSEHLFQDDYHATKQNDEFSRKYPQRNDVLVDTKYQRPSSPIRREKPFESNTNNDSHRSTYIGENDRSKYMHEGEKLSYGSGTSKIVDIPVISNTKRSDSVINKIETSTDLTRDNRRSRSRSPSVASNDSYQRQSSRDQRSSYERQSSRERQTDFTDDYSHSYINTDNYNRNNRKPSNDYTVNTIVSDNPAPTGNYYRSSSSSSYDNKYRNTTSTSNFNDRRSPSPQNSDRQSSVLSDLVSKTNIAGNASPSTGKKFSAIDSLITSARQRNTQDDDDDFDN